MQVPRSFGGTHTHTYIYVYTYALAYAYMYILFICIYIYTCYESQPVGLAEVIDASEASLGGPGGRAGKMSVNRVK